MAIYFKPKFKNQTWNEIVEDYNHEFINGKVRGDTGLRFESKEQADNFFITQIQKKREFFCSLEKNGIAKDYHFVSSDQVFYSGTLEKIKNDMDMTIQRFGNNQAQSPVPKHLKNKDFNNTKNWISIIKELISQMFNKQKRANQSDVTSFYRQKLDNMPQLESPLYC
ncbi:hypothetical protein E3983_03405 [Legionella israelensis]|uniref:Uncharacterized protein n=1 Tax=Legionella israelensis TaxID=454 RepID=A0AAX1EEN4_9GAMM|nr:hypothetical protein [Legionella israelensis]QBR83492.1 hypothetical protein E3983_03405 [Legionella israelensis]